MYGAQMLPQVERKLGLIFFNNINAAPGPEEMLRMHEVDPYTYNYLSIQYSTRFT